MSLCAPVSPLAPALSVLSSPPQPAAIRPHASSARTRVEALFVKGVPPQEIDGARRSLPVAARGVIAYCGVVGGVDQVPGAAPLRGVACVRRRLRNARRGRGRTRAA